MPAVYAMYGGRGAKAYVAYVGIAENLKDRVGQHLVRRDSSVVTGVSAVSLNPDLITEVRWWENPQFAERSYREGAELVAFEVLEPILRSRGVVTAKARLLAASESFQDQMRAIFKGEPSGRLHIETLQSALQYISELERRISKIEDELAGQ